MTWLIDLLYLPAALLYLPILLYRIVVVGKDRRGWRDRLGFVARRSDPHPSIWIHAVSVGEVNATGGLVSALASAAPDAPVVVSTTTDTGFAAARSKYPDRLVFRYPLDFSWCVRSAIRRVQPAAIVLMELEVWPNLVLVASKLGIPVIIANGRVTEQKSMRRFRWPVVRTIGRAMFRRLARVCAQDDTYAARFIELGVPADRVSVTGSVKYDTAVIGDSVPGADALAAAMEIDRSLPLVVAGSTGPGEEEMLLEAYAAVRTESPRLQLAIIPRKPERFGEVANMIGAHGYRCVRRSTRTDAMVRATDTHPRAHEVDDRPAVFLGDTMGELRKFYSLADAVFVGRSLVPMGGSDVIEVAGLGKPMCFGPFTENFKDAVEQLLSADAAVQLDRASQLGEVLPALVKDAEARDMGRRAQELVRRNVGASQRTAAVIAQTLSARAMPASQPNPSAVSAAR